MQNKDVQILYQTFHLAKMYLTETQVLTSNTQFDSVSNL